MSDTTRVVEIRLNAPISHSSDLVAVQRELAAKVRRARSVTYEERKRGESSAPRNVVFALDRRVDWSTFPELLEQVRNQLRSPASHRRNPNSSQWMLYSEEFEPKVCNLYQPQGIEYPGTNAEITELARRSDMEGILADKSVFFHHDRQAFFRLPSGEISDYFLRVGNVQHDPHNIEKIAFWALPRLSDIHHVLCETWSISTTAATIAQFIDAYRGEGAVTWSYLSAYLPQKISDIHHVTELFSQAARTNTKLLFLVSASASGRIHGEYLKLARQADAEQNTRILTIYQLNRTPCEGSVIHPLADFLDDLGLKGATDSIDVGSAPVIEIDTSTYIPKYRGVTTKPFSVIQQTGRAREFYEKYSGNGIFSIARKGRTSNRSPGRHYTYHLDIKKLMDHPAFTQRLGTVLSNQTATTTVVLTPSNTNRQFLEIFCVAHEAAFGCRPTNIVEIERLTQISDHQQIKAALTDENEHVTFVESLLVEGANLNDLTQTIRKIRDQGFPSKAHITYLAGLFRPYSDRKEKWVNFFPQCSDHPGFQERTKIVAVETVILPKWSDNDCPWKRELRAQEKALEVSELDDWQRSYIQRRVLQLTDAMKAGGDGLRGAEVFFQRQPGDEFPFWAGSFWLDKSAVVAANEKHGVTIAEDDIDVADLVCAVASAVHAWRYGNPNSSVLSHDLSFDEVINQEVTSENVGFNEPMLRAAIWRSLKPGEISASGSNSDTASMLSNIFLDQDETNQHRVLGGEAALIYAWRLRGLLGPDGQEKVDWPYLLHLAESVDTT